MARAVVRIHARVLASILSSLLFMQVGPCRPPAHVPTPQEASHPSLLLLAASRRQQCSSLVARVRGGGGGADATPPLVAATGFDAQADDETEELVVDSPGNDVLAPASGRAATPFRDRGARTEVLFPGRSLAPGSGMPVPLGKVPHMPFAPGLAHRAVPVSGAQPMGSRLQRQVRPDTPASSRYGSARELEQSGSARPETASKSMETRIAELEAALSDRSSDWSQRLSALKGLLVVMSSLSDTISKDASGADHRTGVLLRIVPGLCSQLQDKRSSLVKEVCHTINGIARLLGSAFEPVAPKLVPALLSLTFVTVRVMSTSAWESLHVISERVRPTILLPELEKGLADSHVPLRQCCASLLAQMLAQRSAVELDPHVASVVDMTVLALNDPGVGVRNKGKEAFTHIAKLFPAQAKQMMLRVSGAMRIQLSKQFADEVPFLAQDSEASESTAVEAGSIVEMLAGSRMLAGKMSGRSRFDEFRAFRRQQQRERKDDQEDVVVFSPMNNPHTETASDSRPQPSRTDRDLLSVPPLRVQVEETGNTRRVSVEPHAGTSRRARGHRGRAAAEETVAWEQRRQAPVSPRVRVRFRDDVIPAPPVDENESDEPALDAGEYRESQQGSCITLEDGDSDEGENESKEADHSECATLLNGQTADDSSSSEGRYTFDSNGDSNRDELHAAVHAEDTRCAKPECSAIAHDQPGGAQEPHFRQQSLGKNTGKKPPRYGVYNGQGWTEVTVGKAAHAATPRKAFVGVRTAMSRKPPVRMPTGVHATANTVKGRGVPTPRGRNAPANMCAIRAHTTSAGALPRPPHAMRENALQAAHRPETEVRHSVWKAGVQAQSRRCTQSARASQGSAATKVVGDGRGIRLERLFQDCDAFLRNRNISGSSAALPAGISSTEATTEQLQHASGAPGEAVANSSMVYQECDMLKRQLSLSHSLTGMLWMTMRCAETLRGVGRGVVQDPRAPVPPVGSGSEVKFASDSLAVDVSSSTMSSQLSQCAVAHSALPTSSSARSQPNLHQLAVSQATTASSSHSSEDSSVDYSSTESSRDSSMASAGAEEPETEEGIADARPSTETRIKETVRQDGQPCVDSVVTESSGDLMPEKDGADSESAPPIKASEPTRTKMESEDTGEDKDGTSEEEEEEEEEDEADNDYEAERQARIRQNMDAMAQLGLERKPAPEPQARALARGRAPAESLGSEDSTPSEWECKGEESSQWETEQTELSEDEGDCRRGRGTDGMLRGERRRTWDWQDHLNKMHEQGKSDKSNLKISLFAPDAQFVGGGKGAGPGILKQKQKLPSLKMHPSRVDPQVPQNVQWVAVSTQATLSSARSHVRVNGRVYLLSANLGSTGKLCFELTHACSRNRAPSIFVGVLLASAD